MKEYLIVGVAAFTLAGGAAFAQQSTESSSTVRSSPSTGSYTEEKSERAVDDQGIETKKNKTHVSDGAGAHVKKSTEVKTPDGSSVSSSQEKSTTPDGGQSMSTETKTHSHTPE